jgi:hypothetical protein
MSMGVHGMLVPVLMRLRVVTWIACSMRMSMGALGIYLGVLLMLEGIVLRILILLQQMQQKAPIRKCFVTCWACAAVKVHIGKVVAMKVGDLVFLICF